MTETFLLPDAPFTSLDDYIQTGGGEGLRAAARLGPAGVLDEVEASGLRGRGGAGFPTAKKWRSIAGGGDGAGTRYVAANGAEGEPGSYKDRALMLANPYQVLEGIIIACRTVGAADAFIGLKEKFTPEIQALSRAAAEMDEAGWTEGVSISLVPGPNAYLFGEETGLLEVIEGNDPLPRHLPPYVYGLYSSAPTMGWEAAPGRPGSNPTLANNVETLANVPQILARGAEWYRGFGSGESPGVALCTVSGDVARAGVAEIELGTTLAEAIDRIGGGVGRAGGVGGAGGSSVKAVLSGVANPVITSAMLDTPLTYEHMDRAGSGLGACGFIVYDDTRDMAAVATAVSRFLYVESCGQCPACKYGTGEITAYLERALAGSGTAHELEVIAARLRTVTDGNRCYLPVQEVRVISSILSEFPDEIAAAVDDPSGIEPVEMAMIERISDGVAHLDQSQARKRPDWTLAESPLPIITTR